MLAKNSQFPTQPFDIPGALNVDVPSAADSSESWSTLKPGDDDAEVVRSSGWNLCEIDT